MKRYMPPILFFNQMAKSMSSWIHMDVPGRENPEKLSQSIQLDSETASFLVDILRHEFNID